MNMSQDLAVLALGEEATCTDGAVSPDSTPEMLAWFKRNKFPLMSIPSGMPPVLVDDRVYGPSLCAEHEWYTTQHTEYLAVREAWLARGIENIMLKSAGLYPSFPHLSDNIDILIRPVQAVAARDVLRRLGYSELRNIEEPKKYLFRKFHDGRSVLAIHVHEEVGWLAGFMDEDALWARMRPSPDDSSVNIPSPEDAILINLAHAGYENKELRLIDVARVRHSLQQLGSEVDWAYMDRVAASRGWLIGLHFLLLVYAWWEERAFGMTLIPEFQRQRLEDSVAVSEPVLGRLQAIKASDDNVLPIDLSYWFCKRLYYRKILSDPTQPRSQRWHDVIFTLLQGIRLKGQLRPQRPFVVSISGLDGSGKTLHAQTLVDALRLCELNAEHFWSRGGSTGLLGAISRIRSRLRRGRADGGPASDALVRRRSRLANPLVRFGWSWAMVLDQFLTYRVWVGIRSRLWRIVVLDRCVFDTAVEMDRSLPTDARWSRRAISAMLRIVPKPDAAVLLDIAPETAKSRKPDEAWHADVDLGREREAYLALADRYGLQVLSADGSFAESNDVLIREVMQDYMVDVETLTGRLLMINPSQRNVPDPFWRTEYAR